MTNTLFSAPVGTLGGPTIEQLFKSCPDSLNRVGNEWRRIGSKIRQKGHFDPSSWKFKELDITMRAKQVECLKAIIELPRARNTPAIAIMCDTVAAYMLSEMLIQPPQYVPA